MFELTTKGRALVYEFEGCDLTPNWPGGASGVTIGIGYDLGYHSASEIRADWGPELSAGDIQRLIRVSGIKGIGAKKSLPNVAQVKITTEAAHDVFGKVCVPRYRALMLMGMPGVTSLPDDAQAALWSLCFNRGVGMVDRSPELKERREMRAIRDLVSEYRDLPAATDAHPNQSDCLREIAGQLRSMKRLWDNSAAPDHWLPGLVRRREAEAQLVESCAA